MRKKALWIAGAASAAVALGGATIASAVSTAGDDQPLSGTNLQQASDAAIASTGPGTVISAETDNDSDSCLSAADRDKAGQAALASVGQGRVGEVEGENEGASAYEVEVIRDDGSEVDVELGADFQVLNTGAPERDYRQCVV
ncbi:putative membrane protein YkoI [Arthrobacter pascens]|uniref:PepSY domain-containing protein n=1 Tax=Arthrobacter pascens TaxID=1677 RepID=UPI0027819564|nr:hypothetical protein [Arthrobacter pascens]MDQ0635716.1 putative membrane protein YkoI [Arthrobacter pascens]